MAKLAKSVSFQMAVTSLQQRNNALSEIIMNIKKYEDSILTANFQDITLAQANGLNEALIDRLSLENKLKGIIHDIKQVISLPDPIGEKFDEQINLSNNLHLIKYRVPPLHFPIIKSVITTIIRV